MSSGVSRRALMALLAASPVAAAGAVSARTEGAAMDGAGAWVSERAETVGVTVYRGGYMDGLAQITETRTVDITGAEGRVSFRGVSDSLVPETVAVEGLPGLLKERNEDYDLITPGSVLQKSVGESVTLVRAAPKGGAASEERGVLRSGPNGVVVDFGDHAEALQCSGLTERLVFDRMPPGLNARPTLSVLLTGASPGRYKVILSYLCTSINWEAHYVARLNPDGRTLDLTGWLTLTNDGAVGFEEAATSMIAGELNLTGETYPPSVPEIHRAKGCWPTGTTHRGRPPPPPRPPPTPGPVYSGGGEVTEVVVTGSRLERKDFTAISPVTTEEAFGDYHLYRLPGHTTVAARQSKQVMMLTRPAVPYEAVFNARIDYLSDEADEDEPGDHEPGAENAMLMLRIDHRRGGPLDIALPRGEVSVVEPDGGRGGLLVGEGRFSDRPVGPPVELRLSDTETVKVATRVVSVTQPRKGRLRRAVEVTLTSLRTAPAVFELRHARQAGFKLIKASRRAGELHGDVMWRVTLQPEKPVVVRYTFEAEE